MSQLVSLTKKENMHRWGKNGKVRKIVFGNSVMTLKYKEAYEPSLCKIYIICTSRVALSLSFTANNCINDFFNDHQEGELLANKESCFTYNLRDVKTDFTLKLECSEFTPFGTARCVEFEPQIISWMRRDELFVLGKKEWTRMVDITRRHTFTRKKENFCDQKQETYHDFLPHPDVETKKNPVYDKRLNDLQDDLSFLESMDVEKEREILHDSIEKMNDDIEEMNDDIEEVWKKTDISDATLKEKYEFVTPLFLLNTDDIEIINSIEIIDSIEF